MTYFYVKALHIIFVVTWFAGLFYIVRLFIYNREAQEKPENERRILTAAVQHYDQAAMVWNHVAFLHSHAHLWFLAHRLPTSAKSS